MPVTFKLNCWAGSGQLGPLLFHLPSSLRAPFIVPPSLSIRAFTGFLFLSLFYYYIVLHICEAAPLILEPYGKGITRKNT